MTDSDARRRTPSGGWPPSKPWWGAATDRAVATFPVSGQPMPRNFLSCLVEIKRAAALTNKELRLVDTEVADAIVRVADEIARGDHWDQFPVDIYQTGSGTSTNMNCNEVIARLAGSYLGSTVHPNDHVNRSQSSNDVIPTAMQLSAGTALADTLIPAMEKLRTELADRATEFWPVIKVARTHLQDATPIRLGQEFRGYAGQLEESVRRLHTAVDELRSVPLGGTATGTGINCHPEFAATMCAYLSERLGIDVRETTNHFHAQATLDVVITAHGQIKATALAIWKIASDLRLLATGPATGTGEITVPDAGVNSSIMPGKSPPAVIESATMVVARVLGNDTTIGFCQTGSFFELNVMMPVAAAALLESIELLAAAADNLADRCVAGLTATTAGPRAVEHSPMMVTALTPIVGYDAAARMFEQARDQGRTIKEIALAEGLDPGQLDRLLDPARLTDPGE